MNRDTLPLFSDTSLLKVAILLLADHIKDTLGWVDIIVGKGEVKTYSGPNQSPRMGHCIKKERNYNTKESWSVKTRLIRIVCSKSVWIAT